MFIKLLVPLDAIVECNWTCCKGLVYQQFCIINSSFLKFELARSSNHMLRACVVSVLLCLKREVMEISSISKLFHHFNFK